MNPLPLRKDILGFLAWLALCFIAAAIGSVASIQAGPFYIQLLRPEWAPPPGVFGPVWSVLYAMMGVASVAGVANWRISRRAHRTVAVPGPACGECLVVLAVFWLASWCAGLRRHLAVMGTDCRHRGHLLAATAAGRRAAAALLAVGEFCRGIEPCGLAAQSPKPGLTGL